VDAGKVHPQPHVILFGNVEKKYFMLVRPTKIKDCATGSRGGGTTTVEHGSTVQ